MVRVGAAGFAEIVFGCHRAPLVEGQIVLPFDNRDPVERRADCNGPTAAAKRTVAAPCCVEPVTENNLKFNGTAMACELVWLCHLRRLMVGMLERSYFASG